MIYCFGNSHVALFSGAPPCGNKTRSIQQKAWVATKEGKDVLRIGQFIISRENLVDIIDQRNPNLLKLPAKITTKRKRQNFVLCWRN